MYRIPVCRVMLVRERTLAAEVKTIRGAADAASVLRGYLTGVDREHFVVLCLNTRHRVTAINTVSIGGLSGAPVHPREVFKPAILANSAAIILGHNHPSGDPEPSYDDRRITEQLVAAGRILGIEVLDHIIVGDDRFISMRECGVMFAPARVEGGNS